MRFTVAAAIVAVCTTLAVTAVAQPSPNFQIAVRKGAMNLQSKYAGPLFAMARGAAPFDAKIAQRNADYLVIISQMPWEDFQPNSLGLPNTKAKDVIFKDADKFKQQVDTLQSDTQKVAAAVRSGDQSAVKSAVQAMGRNCNSCHENFSDFEFRFKFE